MWTGDQVPWNFKYPKDPIPSGPFVTLNSFPGGQVFLRGSGSSSLPMQILKQFPGGKVIIPGLFSNTTLIIQRILSHQ